MRPTPNHMVVRDTPDLHGLLVRAIQEFKPKNVLETGTYQGTGTTRVLLNALGDYKVNSFQSVEVSPQCFAMAQRNLAGTIVQIHHGLTVDLAEATAATMEDAWLRNPPENIAIDVADPVCYLAELNPPGGSGRENIISDMLPLERPLICLDSAGSVGKLEFEIVCRIQPAPFLLLLDDVNHVKHHRSKLAIESDPTSWRAWGMNMIDGWMLVERL